MEVHYILLLLLLGLVRWKSILNAILHQLHNYMDFEQQQNKFAKTKPPYENRPRRPEYNACKKMECIDIFHDRKTCSAHYLPCLIHRLIDITSNPGSHDFHFNFNFTFNLYFDKFLNIKLLRCWDLNFLGFRLSLLIIDKPGYVCPVWRNVFLSVLLFNRSKQIL